MLNISSFLFVLMVTPSFYHQGISDTSFLSRKLLKKHAEFVFLTSPLRVPALTSNSEAGDDGGSGWWFSQPNDYFKAQDQSECVKGYEASHSDKDSYKQRSHIKLG